MATNALQADHEHLLAKPGQVSSTVAGLGRCAASVSLTVTGVCADPAMTPVAAITDHDVSAVRS
jgi:hypothetical protein